MAPRTSRILRALFVLYVAMTAVHIGYVVAHEPYAFDSWNVSVDTGAKAPSVGRFLEFWHQQYTTSNPRIGQPLTYWAYKVAGVAEVGSPLAYLALVLGGFVLALGRWPERRSGRDLATLAIGTGFLWFAAPDFASYLFCRAYATNYVWAAAIQLWFVVALVRLHEPTRASTVARTLGIGVLGIAAGACNEHTGPTLVLFTIGYAAWIWRRHALRSWFAIAAAAGSFLGFAAIFFAPGQAQRYDDFLKQRFTVTEQILVRGISGNLEILRGLLFAAAPLLVVVFGMLAVHAITERDVPSPESREDQRRSLSVMGLALLAAILITVTTFASPKLGPRFYMHGMILVLAAAMGIAHAFLRRPRALAPFVAFAVIASSYAIARTVPLFTRLARQSQIRLAGLEATHPGEVFTAESFEQVSETAWFFGDDFRDQKKRELVAKYFGLDRVVFRGVDASVTLGVTDVKLTTHYQVEPPVCLDEIDGLLIPPYVGRDIAALHHAFLDSIVEIRRTVPGHLHSIDLLATFVGKPPPMPRARIYVARWTEGVMEGYVGGVKRQGRSKDREVVVPPTLTGSPWEVFIVAMGDAPRSLGMSNTGQRLLYRPWKRGPYWALACRADYCFVLTSLNHT